eukprot:TRINITY_DN18563_c0_g1_i1.p2 TRINITY_DN18563_c0_g1~~TRINITY_DN18563_c0_g1_i1.p2  ORF type:complete len:305 (+),score=89.14 TRINITY_DN18563_c0_g1_i1:75-989(+)
MHDADALRTGDGVQKSWALPRVRPDQSLAMPIFVTGMVLGYLFFAVYAFGRTPAADADATRWERETATNGYQRVIAVVETAMVLWCLWGCVLTDAGRVPLGWAPDGAVDAPETVLHAEYCRKCEAHKMPRVRHCAYCRRCVARYDHHCDWVDNCIGYRNHKFFVLFLWYVTAMIIHYFYVLFYGVFRSPDAHKRAPQSTFLLTAFLTCVMLYTLLAFGLLLFAGTFCFGTTVNLVRNQTTIETEVPSKSLAAVYNKGVYRNLQEVLGPNPLLWLIPTTKPLVQPEFDRGAGAPAPPRPHGPTLV